MTKRIIIIVIALTTALGSMAQTGIYSRDGGRCWEIVTDHSCYILRADGSGLLYPAYWGSRSAADSNVNYTKSGLYEIPVRGLWANKQPLVEVLFNDGVRDIELQHVSAETIDVDGRPTLKIVHKDKHYPIEVTGYIRVLPEYDIMEKWIEVQNTSSKKKDRIQVENLLSASMMLAPGTYSLIHHGGTWGRECQLFTTELTPGTKTLSSRDFNSFENTPWFAVTREDEKDSNQGEVWFGQVCYAGNWCMHFDRSPDGHVQISGGINYWDTWLTLDAGECVTTPKMVFGYTRGGADEAARLNHAYIRGDVLPESHRDKLRPVLYNSWYATTFNVNEDQQVRLAERAAALGVELFVIDDGWFKGRKNDHGGLGDWTVDPDKFPNGLQPMIERINALGLDFGIWVEPEMVNPNSDLFRQHPDWALQFPNRTLSLGRNQCMLNLAREDVYNYLLESLTKLLSENNIKFIKWDRNRALSQPGWDDAGPTLAREVRLRFMDNLDRLVDTLRERFPDVWFESCSSGGGRISTGMLAHMDQVWASDNTDPLDRLRIQYGYLSAWPANTMVSWITHENNYQMPYNLDFRLDVAMQGVLGIGNDITQWTDEEMATTRNKIALYKEIRETIQHGDVYRLLSPDKGDRTAIQYVDSDKSHAVLMCYNMSLGAVKPFEGFLGIRLQGLNPDATYTITGKEETFTGRYLMDVGIPWPVSGSCRSQIIRIDNKQ